MAAAPWKALLQRSLASNASLPYAKYVQLASVRADGRPACRTVVFRGFALDTDNLTFVTDRRSRKVAELAANPAVEVCWYFPSSREQYRLSGVVDVIAAGCADGQLAAARQAAWARMSDAGRSQFAWPEPGQPRMTMDESLFLVPAPDSAGEAVGAFCLCILQVNEVDHVDLYTNKRTVFRAAQPAAPCGDGSVLLQQQAREWSSADVNP